jgi:hypothetical protein
MKEETKPRRLCSEIQLFDLCTKGDCDCKDGRYCRDESILAKFETISEEDVGGSGEYLIDELEDFEDPEDAEYGEDSHDDFDDDFSENDD